MITLGEASRYIKWAIGGGDMNAAVPEVLVANEAGHELVNMRRWKWLPNVQIPRNLVANQAWIDLPTDFAEAIELTGASDNAVSFTRDTPGIGAQSRSSVIPNSPVTFTWWLESNGNAAQGEPTQRIALDHAPGSNAANAAYLTYRAGWTPLEDDGDVAVIPPWMEGLYRDCLFAVARGYMRESEGTVADRLERVMRSARFQALARRDLSMQPNLGQMAGGAVQSSVRPSLHNPDISIGPPVSY